MITVDDIAVAIAAELNAAVEDDEFSFEFEAAVEMLPSLDLKDLNSLHVTIVPAGLESANLTRSTCADDMTVDVAIQQRIDPNDLNDEVQALAAKAGELVAFLRRLALSTVVSARWFKLEQSPIYAVDHLRDHHVFTSVIRTAYRVEQ